jgi:hypothetical protein
MAESSGAGVDQAPTPLDGICSKRRLTLKQRPAKVAAGFFDKKLDQSSAPTPDKSKAHG